MVKDLTCIFFRLFSRRANSTFLLEQAQLTSMHSSVSTFASLRSVEAAAGQHKYGNKSCGGADSGQEARGDLSNYDKLDGVKNWE